MTVSEKSTADAPTPSAPSGPRPGGESKGFRRTIQKVVTSSTIGAAAKKEANSRHVKVFKMMLKKKYQAVFLAWFTALAQDGKQELSQGEFLKVLRDLGLEEMLKMESSSGQMCWSDLVSSESQVITLEDLDPLNAPLLMTFKELAAKYPTLDALWRDAFLMKAKEKCKVKRFVAGCARMGMSNEGDATSLFKCIDFNSAGISLDSLEWLGLAREAKKTESNAVEADSKRSSVVKAVVPSTTPFNISKLRSTMLMNQKVNNNRRDGNAIISVPGSVQGLFANFWGNFWAKGGRYNVADQHYQEAEEAIQQGLTCIANVGPNFKKDTRCYNRREEEARHLAKLNLDRIRQNRKLVQDRPEFDRTKIVPRKPDKPKQNLETGRPFHPTRTSNGSSQGLRKASGRSGSKTNFHGVVSKPQPYK